MFLVCKMINCLHKSVQVCLCLSHSVICHSTADSTYHTASCLLPYLGTEVEVAREVYVGHLQHL
jgi:hypothetical protein